MEDCGFRTHCRVPGACPGADRCDFKWSVEIAALVDRLHELVFDEGGLSEAVLERMHGDEIEGIVERLRVLTDDEYAECAYGED
jgi:hypothetical protein